MSGEKIFQISLAIIADIHGIAGRWKRFGLVAHHRQSIIIKIALPLKLDFESNT